MQKEAEPAEPDSKKELALGKGKLPEEQAPQDKPVLKPPMLITPEVVHTRYFAHIPSFFYFFFKHIFIFTFIVFFLIFDFLFTICSKILNALGKFDFLNFILYNVFFHHHLLQIYVSHLCIYGIRHIYSHNNRMQRLKIKRQVFLLKPQI